MLISLTVSVIAAEYLTRLFTRQQTFSYLLATTGAQWTTNRTISYALKPSYVATMTSIDRPGEYVTIRTNRYSMR